VQAGNELITHHGILDRAGDRAQRFVAVLVAELVVDRAQALEVNGEDREKRFIPGHRLEPTQQFATAGKTCALVPVCQALELRDPPPSRRKICRCPLVWLKMKMVQRNGGCVA
jgi:hypothetical protein